MKHRKKRLGIFLPPNQNTTKAIQPTMRPLNNPTTRLLPRIAFDFFRFFAARANMQGEPELVRNRLHFITHVSRIQIQVLLSLFRRPRPTHDNRLDCLTGKFHVVTIRAVNRYA